MSTSSVADYLRGPFQNIDGWCIPHLWQSIQPLALAMRTAGVDGPVAEIGVYHGKFFIGLVKTMNAPDQNTAIDVFDMQQYNLDKAGVGNETTLRQNLELAGVSTDAVTTIRMDSMWLTQKDAANLVDKTDGGYSFFSVDGCHLPEHTINDVLFAMQVTRPEGIIFVDDYYNANWPGVQEGISKLYLNSAPRFVPLLFTCNKLLLCNLSFHDCYLSIAATFIGKNFESTRVKRVKRFGFDTLTVTPNFQEPAYLAANVEALA